MIRNRCNIFWADGVIHTKNGGKTYASCASRMMQFSLRFGVDNSINPKNITTRIEPVGEPYREVCLSP